MLEEDNKDICCRGMEVGAKGRGAGVCVGAAATAVAAVHQTRADDGTTPAGIIC